MLKISQVILLGGFFLQSASGVRAKKPSFKGFSQQSANDLTVIKVKVRLFPSKIHQRILIDSYIVWKLTITLFPENFVKTMKLPAQNKELISRIFFSECVWKNEKLSLTGGKFRQIKSSNFLGKTVAFTKFLPNKCERKIFQFPHCEWYLVILYCYLTFSTSILRINFFLFLTINFSVFVGPFEAFVLLMADPGADGGDTVIWVWAIWK